MADELMGLSLSANAPGGDSPEEMLAFAKRMVEAHNETARLTELYLGKLILIDESPIYAGILHGNLADRPAGGTSGRAYFADDKGIGYLDDGTDFATEIMVTNHASLSGITIDDHHRRDHASGGHYSGGLDVLLHASMNISSDDHHAKNHAVSHYSGGADPLTHSGLVGLGSDDHSAYLTSARLFTWINGINLGEIGNVSEAGQASGNIFAWSATSSIWYPEARHIEAWASWDPARAVSGGTAPTYTESDVSRYVVVGKICYWMISWTNIAGGTAGAGTNPLLFQLPIASSANYPFGTQRGAPCVGFGYLLESGGTAAVVSADVNVADNLSVAFRYGSSHVSGNDQSSVVRNLYANGFYEID